MKTAKKCDFAHTPSIGSFTSLVIRKTFKTPSTVLFLEKLGILVGWVVFFSNLIFNRWIFFNFARRNSLDLEMEKTWNLVEVFFSTFYIWHVSTKSIFFVKVCFFNHLSQFFFMFLKKISFTSQNLNQIFFSWPKTLCEPRNVPHLTIWKIW